MSLKFYEAIKTILSDFESFLTISLKTITLPSSAANDKEDLLTKLKALRHEFPQLNVESREKTVDTVSKSERAPNFESQEIYDAIGDDVPPSESPKPASSSSDVSEVQQPSLSAADLSVSASICGNLVRKNIGKSKMDLKNIFSSVFGKKFCLVSGGVFFFYDKASSKRANGSFPLKGYETRALTEQSSKKEFCFELVCPGQKSYLFAAATQEEMDKWVAMLNREALQIPDARLSVFCDVQSVADDDDLEYEDPSAATQNNQPAKQRGPPASVPQTPVVDEEFYDDIVVPLTKTSAKPGNSNIKGFISNDDDEIYDEAESKSAVDSQTPVQDGGENDDLMYEAYDDVQVTSIPDTSVTKNEQNVSNQAKIPYEKMYYGKWDCKADSENELAFKRGDIIEIISQDYDKFGWWIGCLQGTLGLVPKEYVTPAYELICG